MAIGSLFIPLWLLCVSAFGQGVAENAVSVLDMRTTAEFLDSEERISGGAIVGALFYDPADKLRLDAAYVYFSEAVSEKLEMQLATVDGRYLVTFDYMPTAPVAGWVRLNLSLSNPEFLSQYDLSEIALLLANAETGVAYPIRWGKRAQASFVRVYINTEGANSYFVTFDTAKNRFSTRSCTKASTRSSFKFDRLCDVPVGDVLANNEIEIIRKRGAGFGTPIRVSVLLSESDNP